MARTSRIIWTSVCIIWVSLTTAGRADPFIEEEAEKFSKQVERAFEALDAKKKSDAFRKEVRQSLFDTAPRHKEKPGYAIVSFVVSDAGEIEGLKIEKSSGDAKMDQAAISAVQRARIPAPPQGLSLQDRTFRVQYISPN